MLTVSLVCGNILVANNSAISFSDIIYIANVHSDHTELTIDKRNG